MDQLADEDIKVNRINDTAIHMKYKLEDIMIKFETVNNANQTCLAEWINFRQTMTTDMMQHTQKTAKKVLNYFKDISKQLEDIHEKQAAAEEAVNNVESIRGTQSE